MRKNIYPRSWRGQDQARRNLHGQIVHEIGLQIVQGQLKPGDAFPTEENFSTELGVSRTVLREAIKVLAEKGLIESRPKLGTRVLPRSSWNLLDADILSWQSEIGFDKRFLRNLIEVRGTIEPTAAKLAAARASSSEVATIEALYRHMEIVVYDDDAYIAVDMEFHAAILAASHNELLEYVASAIGTALLASRKITVQLPGSSEKSLPLHQAVMDAICNRDQEAAYIAMQALINHTAADIDRMLNKLDGVM